MIQFSNADAQAPLRDRTAVKQVLQKLFEQERQPLKNLRYIFCTDEYLLRINRDFLQHDFYTDIITFQLGNEPDTLGVEGEIYVSVERVRDNARTLAVPIRQELLRVIFHGALHLCGYGDKTSEEEVVMRAKEDEYIRLLPG
jgi:probable rRNA maturation factor